MVPRSATPKFQWLCSLGQDWAGGGRREPFESSRLRAGVRLLLRALWPQGRGELVAQCGPCTLCNCLHWEPIWIFLRNVEEGRKEQSQEYLLLPTVLGTMSCPALWTTGNITSGYIFLIIVPNQKATKLLPYCIGI